MEPRFVQALNIFQWRQAYEKSQIMKRSITLFLLFSVAFILYAKEHNDQIFPLKKYNLKWGMTRQEVINIKYPNLHCDNLYCCISDFQFLGDKYLCSLYFEENRMTYIDIMITQNRTKKNGIALLNKYTDKINKIYGINQRYKRENKLPEKNQLGENKLLYDMASDWTRPDGKVFLILTGLDDSCYLKIIYASWKNLQNMQKEKIPKVGYKIDYAGVK
jgi:hypothetical protein